MAYAKVVLEDQFGRKAVAPLGFSWLMLFFGLFVPLFRGDLKHAIISLIAAIVTAGISWLIYPFFYNAWYFKDLVMAGYKVLEVRGADIETIERRIKMRLPRHPEFQESSSESSHKDSRQARTSVGDKVIDEVENDEPRKWSLSTWVLGLLAAFGLAYFIFVFTPEKLLPFIKSINAG